jgi:hypothetical protein
MLTGVYAARNIVGEKHDVWSVNTEQEYHEEVQVQNAPAGDRLVPRRIVSVTAPPAVLPDTVLAAAFARLDPLALGVAVGTVSGVGIFVATAVLLLKGGSVVGPTLSLLGHYLWGFEATWGGACAGLVEGSAVGFGIGFLGAWLRNRGLNAYASLVRRRAQAEAQRRLLDQV